MSGFSNSKETGKPVKIKDEGLTLVNNVSSIDFAGAGVSGSAIGDDATETITTTLAGTINEIAYFDSATSIASLAVATYPSLAELARVKGVSSALQTQLDLKAPLATPIFTSKITIGVAAGTTGSLELVGTTSGKATITVPAAAGTPTYTLPAAVGAAGQVLTDAAGDGILSWAAGGGSGGLIQTKYVEKAPTNDWSTTSTSLTDIPQVTITLTTGARRCLVIYQFIAYHDSAGNRILLDIVIDGESEGARIGTNFVLQNYFAAASQMNALSLSFITKELAAGEHIIKIRARTISGTLFISGTGYSKYIVQELVI